MIHSLYFSPGKELQIDLAVEDFPTALQDPRGLLWVDFEGTSPEADEPILREVFGFHPLAIDDALQESHVPKVDDWGEYLYIVLHSVAFDRSEGGRIETHELDIFLGKNYLVTHHDPSIPAVKRVLELSQRDERHLSNGPDHLLYRLTDEVVASYMPVVEEMDEAIDLAEDRIFSRATSFSLEAVFTLKRAVLHLRRIIGPQREVLNKLARDDYQVIDARARVYFRDVYDHLVRLHDITESIRDLVGGTLDTYLSVINNRMNEIMRTLTIITTLFMPISFIASFFGMNFFQPTDQALDPWTGISAFAAAMALILLTPVGMLFWMRSRGWMFSDSESRPPAQK
ncbi:MAG TPA: magnesium/cobalt transporter CorA [Anaerolineales bacterium]|nr:magnesium/cobalt transporter CorA [Anaerolineales bacterium]